jgi:DHA3 family tetracycline resistance protein-like MFS transporter
MTRKIMVTYQLFQMLHILPMSLIFTTYVLFLKSNGLTLAEIGIVNAIFGISITMFEIPTGVVADVFGRRRSVLLGLFIFIPSHFIYWLGYSMPMFLLAEVTSALAFCFISGAMDAWLRDSLDFYEVKYDFARLINTGFIMNRVGTIVGGLIGSVIAWYDLRIGWLLATILQIIVFVWFLFKMQPEEYFQPLKFQWLKIWSQMKQVARDSFVHGLKTRIVWLLTIISTLYLFASQPINMQWTIYLEEKISLKIIGVMWILISLTSMAGAWVVGRIMKHYHDERQIMTWANLVLGVSLVLMILSQNIYWVLALFLVHEAGRGMFPAAQKAYLHDHIPSDKRATVASFASMVEHLGMAIGWLGAGVLARNIGIIPTWQLAGVIFLVGILLIWKLPLNNVISKL